MIIKNSVLPPASDKEKRLLRTSHLARSLAASGPLRHYQASCQVATGTRIVLAWSYRFSYCSALHTHTSPVMHPDGTIWNLMDIVQSLCNRLRRTLRVAKSSPRAKGGRAGEAFYCRTWGSTDTRKKEKRLQTYYLGPWP